MADTTIKENFDKCLERGEQLEQELIILLKKIDADTHKDQEGNYKWNDIVMPTIKKKIELKGDEKSEYTGNFAVEIRCKGELSGLSVTHADYFVMATKGTFYFFRTDDLKSWIKTHAKELKIVMGGDDMNSQLILIPKLELTFQYFTYALIKTGVNIKYLEKYLVR